MARQRIWRLVTFVTLCALTVLAACSSPDPQGRFDEFKDGTSDRRGGNNATNNGITSARIDFSGTYFLSASTVLSPDKPLYLQADVTVAEDLSTIDFVFTPLTIDLNDSPRTPVGEPIVVTGVPYSEVDGTFTADLGVVTVTGEANPITMREIVASLVLTGAACDTDIFCGTVDGTVTSPVQSGLTGSTFAAVRSEDFATATSIYTCPDGCGVAANNGPNNGTNNGTNNATNNGGLEVRGRCVDGLEGSYTLYFITATQLQGGDPPTELTLDLTLADDPAACYIGALVSRTSGDTIGTVESVVQIDGGLMSTQIRGFIIPPGANPLLPDGGKADIELKGTSWNTDGACGDMDFKLVEPFPLSNTGTFAALRTSDTTRAISGATATCADITANEACGFEELAGRYRLWFITDTQRQQGTDATQLVMNLEPSGLTCLGGTIESLLEPGTILTRVQSARTATDINGAETPGLAYIRVNNFGIPAGANPLLPNGGAADFELTARRNRENQFCGALKFSLFDPFPLGSGGGFAAGIEGVADPLGPTCEPCQQYCWAVADNCTGDNAIDFGADTTCYDACIAFTDDDSFQSDVTMYPSDTDTAQCRAYHADAAAGDAATHCPHAAPVSTVCQ